MRKTFVLIAAALMAFGAVSCKKEIENNDLSNRPVRFSATMENSGDSKTTLNGYALLWADGDQVKVMCDEFTTAGVYQVVSGGKRHADFVFAGEESSEETLVAPFKAGYPADYWNDNVTSITLPATQNYVANGMEQFPMYGEVEEGFGVDFKNVCGVIRLRLVKPSESVTKIVLSTTKYMNGEFGVSFTEGVPAIEHLNGGDNFITLNCAEPVSINSATDFYIYLPAGTYNPMRIEVYNNRGLLCEMNSTANITIERNKITTIAPSAESLKFNYVAGLITVNAQGKQVRFATGNLIYNTTTSQFEIADEQFESYNAKYTATNTPAIVDLFYFSQGNTNNYGLTQRVGTYEGFVDWSEALGSDNEWYTLTAAEWAYAASNNPQERYHCWSYAKVTTADNEVIRGIVLVPDYFQAPEGFTYKPWGSQNALTRMGRWDGEEANNKMNHWTADEWHVLEQYGVVFIPAYNTPTSNSPYWTASPDPYNKWLRVPVENKLNSSSSDDSPNAVRLVQTYVPLTITVE